MLEWRLIGLEVDAHLALRNFEAVERLGAQLCQLRPELVRGWSLRYLAMSELSVPLLARPNGGVVSGRTENIIKSLLQECTVACECDLDVERITAAVQHLGGLKQPTNNVSGISEDVQRFVGEWDAEGVYVYQAFCDDIADWALAHQQFGGPKFNTTRMTWVKPSFGWVLYRSGYGHKPGQNRVLKIKLSHHSLGVLLSACQCVDTNKTTRSKRSVEQTGNGRVQWDPERDMMTSDGREPRELRRQRAIQIGLKGRLSDLYVTSVISIQDVTELCHKVCDAHRAKKGDSMAELVPELPIERPYLPHCRDACLSQLGMLPGPVASAIAQLGRGKAQ